MWELTSGVTMRSFSDVGGIANIVLMMPNSMVEPNLIQFFTLGNTNHLCMWAFSYKTKDS